MKVWETCAKALTLADEAWNQRWRGSTATQDAFQTKVLGFEGQQSVPVPMGLMYSRSVLDGLVTYVIGPWMQADGEVEEEFCLRV